MRILVSGAGPAGLTSAYWLAHYGHEVVLVERHPHLRRDGYGLDFFGTGLDVAIRMGLHERLCEHQIKADFLGFVDDDGGELGRITIQAICDQLKGLYVPLMHYSLEDVLYEALPEVVGVRFGTHVERVEQTDRDVGVELADGTSDRFDVIVGAEGIHSHLRHELFGSLEEFGRYLDLHVACFMFENDLELGPGWLNLAGIERSVGVYPTDVDGQYASLFIWKRASDAFVEVADRPQMLRDEFSGAGWVADDLLERMPPAEELFFDSVTQLRLPSWSNGRVVLTGDAAYCLTLLSGQGSSMALAGGFILAEELGLTDDHALAFARYENRLRPHIELRQDKARDLVKSFVPGSKTMKTAEELIFRVFLRDAFAGTIASHLYMGASLISERMLHRLPESTGNVLGYRLSGKLGPEDIAMIDLDVQHALGEHDEVRILCKLDDFERLTVKGLVADFAFGREHADRITRLAVVGDGAQATALATGARPFGHWDVERFSANDELPAWKWLAS